jgi:hypothetical protein
MFNKKYFNKDIIPQCIYCKVGKPILGGSEVLCIKHGIMLPTDSCRSYKYDPLKREPKIKTFSKDYDPKDLKL